MREGSTRPRRRVGDRMQTARARREGRSHKRSRHFILRLTPPYSRQIGLESPLTFPIRGAAVTPRLTANAG